MKKAKTILKRSFSLLLALVMVVSTNIIHVSAAEPSGVGKYVIPVTDLISGAPIPAVQQAFANAFGSSVEMEIKEDGTKEAIIRPQHMIVNFGGQYHCNVLTVEGATVLSTKTEKFTPKFGNPQNVVDEEVPEVLQVKLPAANSDGGYEFTITVDFMNSFIGNGNPYPTKITLKLDMANATEIIDYTDLNQKIAELRSYDKEMYAEKSYVELEAVLKEAESLTGNAGSSKDVNDMIQKLNKTAEGLINISELKNMIADAKELKKENYTEDTYTKFVAELGKIEKAVKDIGTKEDVSALQKNLEDAKKELKYAGGDYSKVEAVIKKIPKKSSNYTKESWDALMESKNAVKYGLNASEQAKIDAYAKDIEEKIDALVLKDADYTKVDNALKKIPNKLEQLYTEESVKLVKDAMSAVVRGLKIDRQKEVDQMAQDLSDAIAKLKKKPVKPQKQETPEQENETLDKNNLKDGIYEVSVELYHATNDKLSMAAQSIVSPAKIVVKNGIMTMYLYTRPMTFGNITASLQEMRVYDLNGNYQNAVVQATNSGNPTCFSFQLPHAENFIKVQVNPHVEMMGNQFLDARLKVNYNTLTRISKDADDAKINVLQASSGTPKTGDYATVDFYVMLMCISFVVAGTQIYRKKFYKEK